MMKKNIQFKEELSGPRLLLRRTRAKCSIAEEIFHAVDESREHLRPFCPWEKKDDSVKSVLKYLKDKEKKTRVGERVEYGIYIRDSEEYIGNIQVFAILQEKRSAEIGYWLKKTAIGKGFMQEALRILEKYCFEELGIFRLSLRCHTENKASLGVIRACSYIFEGQLRGDRFEEGENSAGHSFLFAKTVTDYLKESPLPPLSEYRIVSMQDNPGGLEKAIRYYHEKWGKKENYHFYKDAILHCGKNPRGIPKFFVLLKNEHIIGCCGLIMNDFVSRQDLWPWLCGLYVEEEERGKALGNMLMCHAQRGVMLAGFSQLYCLTDYCGYYERYGWEFLGMAYEQNLKQARIYKKTLMS